MHGREYCFGGHDGTESGIFTMRPRVGIPGITLRQSIVIGKTRMSEVEVHRLAVLLGRSSYRGVDYNLLSRYSFCIIDGFGSNCNHFSDTFCRQICGAKIPRWINRLAYIGTLVPPSWLPIVSNVPVAPDPGVDDGRREQ